jgi:hypothetical protein
MWDAWAAFDPVAVGYMVEEKYESADVVTDREVAISFAAYRILLHRYAFVVEVEDAFEELQATMGSLCLDVHYSTTGEVTPAALGNRIAAAIIERFEADGSQESQKYRDEDYEPVNEPLVVLEPGASPSEPNRWQPLALAEQVTQNGLVVPDEVQMFVGSQWGRVEGFALHRSVAGLPLDPGPPPLLGDLSSDEEFREAAVEVIRYSALLDPTQSELIDVGPASRGGSTPGTNDGTGHRENPVTGEPYASNPALHADYGRAIAEFWADGPDSETPPGHWNTIANVVSDRLGAKRRIAGAGPTVDQLEWDVKLGFVLNGALHDAAVATWGSKVYYDYSRPISMIRYTGGLGQSSDPNKPSYDPQGLLLVSNLVEVVTAISSARGGRHEHLADHVGEVAIRSWRGPPPDPTSELSGVGWVLAVDWLPYQRPTFVTPAFAGYVSGHSAFSRAAAVVLALFTGDEFFPGGLQEWTVDAGDFIHEVGPSEDLTLQWATYGDAADEAGLSRLYGGIHVPADDLNGRILGAICGEDAWAVATTYFDGSASV